MRQSTFGLYKKDVNTEQKIISVSTKRQVTIPQKFFNALGFGDEAECILQDDGLLIRPVRTADGNEFSEQILADLISQGYEGQQLLGKYKEYKKAIRPAVMEMLKDNKALAESGEGKIPIDELFAAEE